MSSQIYCQGNISFGVLPRINLSKKVFAKTKIKGSIETRFGLIENLESPSFETQHILTDYSVFTSTRLDPDRSLNIGYMLRTRDGQIFHRFAQHLNLIQQVDVGRIGHRIGLDQTFTGSQSSTFRFRYRWLREQSLGGFEINKREWYLKYGAEFLSIYSDESIQGEFRLLPSLGFEYTALQKIEIGIDYRFKSIFQNNNSQDLWIRMTYYQSLEN